MPPHSTITHVAAAVDPPHPPSMTFNMPAQFAFDKFKDFDD